MATYIASQVRPDIGTCLNGWYYKTENLREKRQAEILEVISDYMSYDPTAVILGYLEGACGKFK